MKKIHIGGLIIVAVVIGIILSTAGDASSYVTFEEARAMAVNGNDNKIHVVGELKKLPDGSVTGIQTGADLLSFTFVMVDENGREQKVFYNEPIPPDFQRSEQVVVVGAYHKDLFVADKILLKCPSKYEETEIAGV